MVVNKKTKVLLVFPPNWSACVNSPHLALPLLAGQLPENSNFTLLDLNQTFYKKYNTAPSPEDVSNSSEARDVDKLNEIYLKWSEPYEDLAKDHNHSFGLISGFTNGSFNALNTNELYENVKNGTVFTDFYHDNLLSFLKNDSFNVILLTCASKNQYPALLEIIYILKINFPSTKIIVGGNYITRLKGRESLKQLLKLVDNIVLYQGEEIIRNLFTNFKNGNIINQDHIKINEWNSPSFNGINWELFPSIQKLVPIIGNRGCYYGKCSFCTIPYAWSSNGMGGVLSDELLLAQIKHLKESEANDCFKFIDESFPLKRINNILDSGINIRWEAYCKVEKEWEDIDFARKAYSAGCRKIYFGLELLKSKNSSLLNKNNIGDMDIILENCNDAGIKVHLFTLLGYPGTTIEDAENVIQYLVDNAQYIDTSDISGFRLEKQNLDNVNIIRTSDLELSYEFNSKKDDILDSKAIIELEKQAIDFIWEKSPLQIHPLYRIGTKWNY